MSIENGRNPQILPVYLPDTRAIALGGEITGIRRPHGHGPAEPAGPHEHEPVSIPLEGASCALGPGVHRALVRRADAITQHGHQTIARAGYLEASARLELSAGAATSSGSVFIRDLTIGAPQESLTIEAASAEVRYKRDLAGGASSFELLKATMLIEGMTVTFRDPDKVPRSYAEVKAAVRRQQGFEFPVMNRAALADESDVPIILSLVDEIVIGQRGRMRPIKEGRGVYVADVGQIYFGELIIREHSRYFSLFRMELGCHYTGHVGSGPGGNGEPGPSLR
jgi:hypothetical protein